MATDVTDIAVRDEQTGITRADPEQAAGALAHILATGDLSQLSDEQRVAYYLEQCRSLGLNPISRPFDWIWFKEPGGAEKLALYPNQSAAAQLRRNHQISVRITRREIVGELFVCEAEGVTPNGRMGQASKYVPLTNKYGKLTGSNLANAFAKAETGALRRLALSMVGLSSPPDVDELKGARQVIVDGTGRIIEHPSEEQRALAEDPGLARVLGEPTYETTANASESPLTGGASQAPTIDELEPPKRPYAPPARFHCDAEQWRKTWFTAVKETVFDSDEARHDFMRWYTSEFPENLRTNSLTTFLSRATDRQAERMINAAREAIAYQAETNDGGVKHPELLEDEDERESRLRGNAPDADEKVRAAAMVTGAAMPSVNAPAAEVERPDPNGTYTRRDLVTYYLAAVKRLKALDRTFKPINIDATDDDELLTATLGTHAEADAIEEAIRAAADPDDEDSAEKLAF